MKPAFGNSSTDPGKGVYFRCIPLIGTNKPNEYSKIVQVSHMKTIFKWLYFVIVSVMRYFIDLKENLEIHIRNVHEIPPFFILDLLIRIYE